MVVAKMCCHIRMFAWPYTKSVWFLLGTIVSECRSFFGGFQRMADLRDGGQLPVLSIYSNLTTCAKNMTKDLTFLDSPIQMSYFFRCSMLLHFCLDLFAVCIISDSLHHNFHTKITRQFDSASKICTIRKYNM